MIHNLPNEALAEAGHGMGMGVIDETE